LPGMSAQRLRRAARTVNSDGMSVGRWRKDGGFAPPALASRVGYLRKDERNFR
jgi:hypothetical protein